MGIKVGRRLPRDLATSLTAVAVFALVGVLRLPMIPVLLALIPISIGLALLTDRRDRHGS
jgi:chromate transporter